MNPHGQVSQREWCTRAACRRYPPEMWWPEQCGRVRARVVAPVIEICWTECPVRPRCAQQALDDGARHGIWVVWIYPGEPSCEPLHSSRQQNATAPLAGQRDRG